MDQETLRRTIEEAVRDADSVRLWSLLVGFIVAGFTGFLASYAGAYLRTKGQNLATKDDFRQLLEQSKKTTRATERIKSRIQRRSSFQEKILQERYSLIKEINGRIEIVRINFERLKKGQPTRIEIVNGETLLLTEIHSDLQLNRTVLTPPFYGLLTRRYQLVSVLWRHENNEDEWNNQIKLSFDINNEIQEELEKSFAELRLP